jgi:heme-degrading monooxygenase HmoA
MQTATSAWKYVVIWEFEVPPHAQPEFERAYGPEGQWVSLFQSGDGYIGTELIRDVRSGRYLTLDFWQSGEHYSRFREQHRERYKEIDRRCEQLTTRELELGAFERIASPA